MPVGVAIVLLGGCATYNEVESEAVTSALEFDDENRFAVEVPDTTPIDSAFSGELQDYATDVLINELEAEGFEYVGEESPDMRFSFSTYAITQPGYVDTTKPVVERVIYEDVVKTTTIRTQSADTITTAATMEPVYVPGSSRLFLLDVKDNETKVLLWRAYVLADGTGLDAELLSEQIARLVERLEEET